MQYGAALSYDRFIRNQYVYDGQDVVRMTPVTTANVTNWVGVREEHLTYDSYGKVLQSVYYAYDNVLNSHAGQALLTDGTTGNDLRYLYTSQEYNVGTGLYNYGGRELDPGVAKFLQEDPIVWVGGLWSLGVYVGNDPVNNTDPSGMQIRDNSSPPEFQSSYGGNWGANDVPRQPLNLSPGEHGPQLGASLPPQNGSLIARPDGSVQFRSGDADPRARYQEDQGRGKIHEYALPVPENKLRDPLEAEFIALIASIAQVGFDIGGMFDPSGVCDMASFGISVGNGDWLGAATSILSIGLPYVGDLAKFARVAHYASVIGNAIEFAVKHPVYLSGISTALYPIYKALDTLPFDKLPCGLGDKFKDMHDKLRTFFSKKADDAAEAAGKKVDGSPAGVPDSPKPKTPDEQPNSGPKPDEPKGIDHLPKIQQRAVRSLEQQVADHHKKVSRLSQEPRCFR